MTQDSTEERRRKHMAVMDDGKENWQSEAMHQNALLHDALTRAEVAEAKLAKAVEDAFCEGFAEGYDGTWVEGDYTHAWKKSHALANLERTK